MKFRPSFAAALLAAGLFTFAAHAEMKHFTAHLTGASEVPPKNTPGSGDLSATLDTATRTLTYTLNYHGLSGPATGAHFHGAAMAGKNSGVQLAIKPPASPAKGTTKLSTTQM